MEIQAGLGKTQYGCIPMAPHTAWEWMERYGAVNLGAGACEQSHEWRYEKVTEELKANQEIEKLKKRLEETKRTCKEAGKASPGRKRIWNICTQKRKKNWTSGICESVRNIKEVETFL